jgi:hypothetical protein
VAVSIRFLVLGNTGTIEGELTAGPIAHGITATASTHRSVTFGGFSVSTGVVTGGVINIESTQVFCNAVIVDADATPTFSVPLGLVRVNPHPGTVE